MIKTEYPSKEDIYLRDVVAVADEEKESDESDNE